MINTRTMPRIIQETLVVKDKKFITPHYIRITLTGHAISKFSHTTAGANNKIFIPPKGVNKIHFPEFDFEKMQWNHPPEEVRPVVRTYTHRGFDAIKNEMYIDFVAHGETGPASAWALHCKPGDILGVAMHDKSKILCPPADWYLLIGDATAIPVLSVILEGLSSSAKSIALIEVRDKEEEQILRTASQVSIKWIHNFRPEHGSLLADKLRNIVLPENLPGHGRFAYVAAEFDTVKAIRCYLRDEQHWKKEEFYAYSYWKAGVSEDNSAMDRRNEHKA